MQVAWCKTRAGPLRYLRRDGHGLPIIALPGAGGRAEHALIDSEGRPFVALDWPGSGESTDALPRWSTSALASLVQEVLDDLSWREVCVLGHSLGAMVATDLAVVDARVVEVVLLAPTPGLLPCLRAGIWPFPPYTILRLVLCALSLCNIFDVWEASKSDLNRAWLLHGLEARTLRGAQYIAALDLCRLRPLAPNGPLVWLQRRIGDVAAVVAVLTHVMPRLHRQRVALLWGERDAIIDARASRLAANILTGSGSARVQTSVSPCGGHFVHWDSPSLVAVVLQDLGKGQSQEYAGRVGGS